MIGFKLNSAGDIEVDTSGKIELLSTIQQAVRQRLDIQHKTWQGEWYLDTTYGIPYRQSILGKGLSKAEVDALYLTVIDSDPDVISIRYFESTYTPLDRLYSLQYEVLTADGLLRTQSPNLYPSEEVIYPTPDSTGLTSSCGNDYLQWVLDIHPVLHDDLPEGGVSTWIYP